jgi:hypothetical protein
MTPKTKLVLNVLSILIGLVWVWMWVVPPRGLRDSLRLIVGAAFHRDGRVPTG